MENFLGALAFAGLIAAQFLAVVFVKQLCEDPTPGSRKRIARVPVCGSLAHSARKAFSSALGYLWLQLNQQARTPVEVQFTSAGCLNYPCRTPPTPLWRPHSSAPIADILTIASCDGLVQQPNGIITSEVEATHRLRRRSIVTSDDCIAIKTDVILVLVHRRFRFLPSRYHFTAKATTRHKRALRRLWRPS